MNPSEENILHFIIAAGAAAMYFFESASSKPRITTIGLQLEKPRLTFVFKEMTRFSIKL
jgi:hypothetical protein